MPYKNRETALAYYRKHYAENREARIAKAIQSTKRLRRDKRDYIRSLKNAPCMDCGETFPPVCMDFDHVNGDKLIDIAKAASETWSYKRIDEEIAKCELVCANCHRIRTEERRCGSKG